MKTETQKITSIHDFEFKILSILHDVSSKNVGDNIYEEKKLLQEMMLNFNISLLTENVKRLKEQRSTTYELYTKAFDYEKQRLKGVVSGFSCAIENLRQEIQSLTSQLNEL